MIVSKYAMAIAASLVIFSPNFAKSADTYDARNDALADPAPRGTYVDWTGLYVSLGLGLQSDVVDIGGVGFGEFGTRVDGRIGADFEISRFLVGAFIGASLSDVEILEGAVFFDEQYQWQAGGRIGYLLSDRFLAYALAAYTEKVVDSVPGSEENLEGFSFGGGFEYSISDSVRLGTEIQVTNFDETFGGAVEPSDYSGMVRLTIGGFGF